MKKVIVVSLLLGICISSVFAVTLPTGVGGKYSAMGGAGASIVDDITCAYYNPAGIVKTGNLELKIAAGAASEGLNDIISTLSNANDPAKFLADNFNKKMDIDGGFTSFVGFNVGKIGVSVIPRASLQFSKPAGTFAGSSLTGTGAYEGILTLGYSLGIPGFPIARLDLGANIKSTNVTMAFSNGTGATTTTDHIGTVSGMGFDLGAMGSINAGILPINVGIVMRDLGNSLKGKIKTQTNAYNPANGTITTTLVGETDAGDTNIAQATVIGASTVIPGVGVKVAIDLDSIADSKLNGGAVAGGNLTHIGLEYPILGIVALRAGQVSGKVNGVDVQQTTFGAGFNLGAVINIAMMTDAKNSKNNSTMIDLGFAF